MLLFKIHILNIKSESKSVFKLDVLHDECINISTKALYFGRSYTFHNRGWVNIFW